MSPQAKRVSGTRAIAGARARERTAHPESADTLTKKEHRAYLDAQLSVRRALGKADEHEGNHVLP